MARGIYLYDNLPEMLFGYLGSVLWMLAALSFPAQADVVGWGIFEGWQENVSLQWFDSLRINPHLLFWIFAITLGVFGVSYRANLSKGKFVIVFGLSGTFLGIPAALEFAEVIHPYRWLAGKLGALAPEMNAGGYFFLGILCWVVWFANFLWSRTNRRAKLDESGLSITRADGTTERYELIGLKTTTSNFDYTEFIAGGIGSLTLSLRTGKKIFELKRVFGLYWTPLLFWQKSKIARIEEMLSYQGKTTTVELDRLEAESGTDDVEDGLEDDEASLGEEWSDEPQSEDEEGAEIS